MKLIKFTSSIHIAQPPEKVFDFTQDYSKRLLWDTFLKKADLTEGATAAGKGVKAYCVAHNGLGMETVYITFNRPEVTAVKMTKGPFMFKTFQASWRFKQADEQNTEVIFLYSFSLRFPFLLFGKMITNILERNVAQRLKDLKKYLDRLPRRH